MLAIVTDRREWRVQASGGLRTSVALVSTWFKVLSGVVVWVCVRGRLPPVGALCASTCVSNMLLAAALSVMLFRFCVCASRRGL